MLLTNKADILDAMDKELAEASPSSIEWLASMFDVAPELKERRVVSLNDWVKILRDHTGVPGTKRIRHHTGVKRHARVSVANRVPSQRRTETIDRTFRIQGISYDSMNKPAFLDILDIETKELIRVRI